MVGARRGRDWPAANAETALTKHAEVGLQWRLRPGEDDPPSGLGAANPPHRLAWMADHFAFDEDGLGDAIRATFARRTTAMLHALALALSREFYENATKQAQWRAFVRRINQPQEMSLEDIVHRIAAFLSAFVQDERQKRKWVPGGP